MLAMPTEMLQRVASFVDRTQLLTLRLTCKELAAAAFDAFADEYISKLACLVTDPARVRRLMHITECQHLALKIETVKLTSDPWETKGYKDLQVAQRWGEDLHHGQRQAWLRFRTEQWQIHYTRRPDMSHLSAALGNLHAVRYQLSVDLSYVDFAEIYQESPYIRHDILDAISRTDHSIHEMLLFADRNLFLGYSCPIDSALFQSMKRLKAFECRMPLGPEPVPADLLSLHTVANAIAYAEDLESLAIIVIAISFSTFVDPNAARLQRHLVLANKFTRLAQLRLCGITLGFSDLYEALGRCHNAVRRVSFFRVILTAPGERWVEVLCRS